MIPAGTPPRLRGQEKVEAAQLELARHRKELLGKKEEVQLRSGTSGAAESGKEWQTHDIFRMVLECFGCICQCQSFVFEIFQLVLRRGGSESD